MVTSSTVDGFIPTDIPTYVTPVQVSGHTVNNLTVARSPLGKAIFGWSSGGIYYCALRTDFEDVYRDDVVPDGDERVVLDETGVGKTVAFGSLWVDRGVLYCALKWQQGIRGTTACYEANSVENPTSWTQRGVIVTRSISGTVTSIVSGGPVTILDTGRWIIPFAGWTNFATGKADASMLAISDDRGIDWTVKINHRESAGGSGTTGPIANTVGQDPRTGYLYWSFYWGPIANQANIYESQDNGTTWTLIINNSPSVWNFCVDNGVDKLYAVTDSAVGEWEWWDVVDPTDDTSYVDLDLTVIASRQSVQFQCIPFQQHGSIALIDTNRIAKAIIPESCVIPPPLHIPHKDRLLNLTLTPDSTTDPASFTLMAAHDFDNMKEIERWAGRWMTASGSTSSCDLFIPFKDHLYFARHGQLTRATQRIITGQAFDNYKVIERWALRVTGGECACGGPDKCRLHIPFKNTAAQIQVDQDNRVDRASLTRAASQDFDNYKTIERWANEYARGQCSTGQQEWPPDFPAAPISPARFAGEMMEVSTVDSKVAKLGGEMIEVSTKQDGISRIAGEMMEVSTKEDGVGNLTGEMMEVAVILP